MTNYEDRTLTLSKHEVVVDRHHDITIVIEGGVCVDVVGLPEEWGYIVQDDDTYSEEMQDKLEPIE
jgi:hypothetical protein